MPTNHASHPILSWIEQRPYWALQAPVLSQMCEVINRHLAGEKLTQEQIGAVIETRHAALRDSEIEMVGRTAVIPISGVIVKYSRLVNGSSQPRGTSVETIRTQLDAALEDAKVDRIVLRVESPGGNVDGVADLADALFQARGRKPIEAFIDDYGASAAYWLASQADSIWATQTSETGSIGIYMVFVDSSAAFEREGFKVLPVTSGKHKGTGLPGTKIDAERLKPYQETIDALHEVFVETVIRGRGKALADSIREAADGRMFVADTAQSIGLIDGVRTWEQMLASRPAQRRELASANAQRKERTMPDEKAEVDVEQIKADAMKQGVESERKRMSALCAEFPDDQTFALAQFNAGATIETAKMAYADVLKEKLAETRADNAKLTEELAAAEAAKQADKGDGPEPVARTGEGGAEGSADFMTLAKERAESKKIGMTEAMKQIAKEQPEAHAAWLGKQAPTKR